MLPVGVGQQKEDRSKKEEDGGPKKKKKHTQKKRPNQMQWLSGESTLKLTGSYRVCAKKNIMIYVIYLHQYHKKNVF